MCACVCLCVASHKDKATAFKAAKEVLEHTDRSMNTGFYTTVNTSLS